MANVSKRTAIFLGAIAGIIVILIGLGIWGFATGKLKIGAYQYWFPEGPGTISGTVTCQTPCTVSGALVWLTSGDGDFQKNVTVSSDGSYSFHRVPIGSYLIEVHKDCPPPSGELGHCWTAIPGYPLTITASNSTKTQNFTLIPYAGKLVISTRRIIVNPPGRGYGQRQSQYSSYCKITDEIGRWDCPVANTKIEWQQGGDKGSGYTNSEGVLILKNRYDYRQVGSVDIKATKGDNLSGYGSTNVIGCQNNTKKIYIK